jgi:hypothetical protein
MLQSNKRQTSPAHELENAKLSKIAIPYWIIYYPSASQYQITRYYQKQSSTDVEGKPYTKMRKKGMLHRTAHFSLRELHLEKQ